MARFRYRATDENGQPVEGDLEAPSIEVAREELAHRGWQVSELMLPSEPSFAGTNPDALGRIANSDAVVLAAQMANVTSAGLPLSSGLRALAEEVPAARIRQWLRAISNRLERGQSLSAIARDADGAWPRYFLAMLDAGQRTGRLPEMLNECVVHLRATADVRRQLVVAMAYPATLIMTAWLLFSFLMSWVVPQMKAIFLGFGTELPGITVAIMNIADVMQFLGWWFLPALLLAIWAGWSACERFGLERPRDAIVSRVPLLGEARRAGALAEFCRLLSLLVQYRVSLPEAVRLAAGSLSDADLRDACFDVAMRVDAGQSLTDAATETGRFPGDLLHLFRWADRGDDFADGLRNASEVLSGQSQVHSHTLAVVCEPAVTVVVGVGVGLIVIALFMPLVKLLNDLS